MFSRDRSVRGLFTTVVAALSVALILALFALFRDVDMQGVQVQANTTDVAALQASDSNRKADVREIRVKLEAVDRIERKLDRIQLPQAQNGD